MTISLIVAKAKNNVIGKNNTLPWHLPVDMKYFKETTIHHHVIMGRKTFESIKSKPLPNRVNIVITRKPDYNTPLGCHVASSLEEAIEIANNNGETEAFIAGGSEIYRLAVPLVDKMYITEVDADIEGDTFFPIYEPKDWIEEKSVFHKADDNNPYNCAFKVLVVKPRL